MNNLNNIADGTMVYPYGNYSKTHGFKWDAEQKTWRLWNTTRAGIMVQIDCNTHYMELGSIPNVVRRSWGYLCQHCHYETPNLSFMLLHAPLCEEDHQFCIAEEQEATAKEEQSKIEIAKQKHTATVQYQTLIEQYIVAYDLVRIGRYERNEYCPMIEKPANDGGLQSFDNFERELHDVEKSLVESGLLTAEELNSIADPLFAEYFRQNPE
jgi:hypothetical protein